MKKHFYKIIIGSIIFIIAFVFSITKIGYNADKLLFDSFYQKPQTLNNKIKIIAIDEKTISEFGDPSFWDRSIPTMLLDKLSDSDFKPSVISFDIMYVSKKDEINDNAFALKSSELGNVVTAVNIIYKDDILINNNQLEIKQDVVYNVEFTYQKLKDSSSYGFANTFFDSDSSIRYTRLSVKYKDEIINSLAYQTYLKYCDNTGIKPNIPKNNDGFFGFKYQAKHNDYEVISLSDVINGYVDGRAFKDSIVFVGAYAPGLMDSYNTPIDKKAQLYGVEIHANIFEALLENQTYLPVNNVLYSFIVSLIALLFYVIIINLKIIFKAITLFVFIALYLIIAKILFINGIEIRILETILLLIIIFILHLGIDYFYQVLKKKKILNAFSKYVGKEVLADISKEGNYELALSSDKKHISVLFVDIRGFTPMSEGLPPIEVVGILNEYLSLTTDSIFKNKGTLDKFIGDATMAIFNAPFELEDYVLASCKTALDIARGSEELNKKLMEKFGRCISYGIGINCGDAVVGNIGCDTRMDYTAIGDTVNTAARLEANAKKGQILISEYVYEIVKDKVIVTEIGAIPLKGKVSEVFVYQLDGLKEE